MHHVNIGPYFIRRKHYEALGGWDYTFSKVGEPGIGYDNELCLRAWLNGYRVAYSFQSKVQSTNTMRLVIAFQQ